jgi:hypothetical protein
MKININQIKDKYLMAKEKPKKIEESRRLDFLSLRWKS